MIDFFKKAYEYFKANKAQLIAILVGFLGAIAGILALIPGNQGESLLQTVIAWLAAFGG